MILLRLARFTKRLRRLIILEIEIFQSMQQANLAYQVQEQVLLMLAQRY